MHSGSRFGGDRSEDRRTRRLGFLIRIVGILVLGKGFAVQAQQSSGPQVSIVWPTSAFGV